MKITVFDPKYYPEVVPLRFPFASEMGAGVTIVSASVVATTRRGVDPAPSALLLGSPAIDASGNVYQMAQAGTAKVSYLFVATALLSNGLTLVRAGVLPVISF